MLRERRMSEGLVVGGYVHSASSLLLCVWSLSVPCVGARGLLCCASERKLLNRAERELTKKTFFNSWVRTHTYSLT